MTLPLREEILNGHDDHTNALQSGQLHGKAQQRDPVSRGSLPKGMSKMADTEHRLTDEKLEEMEKRLSAIYSRAEKEITKTAEEYFAKFAKQDEAKRKLLEQGKITEDEYKKWRKGKVMYGKRFTEMKEQCAKQLLYVHCRNQYTTGS